jgi:hypothetical protein
LSAAIAVKSFVNCDDEIVGVEEDEDVEDDELPPAALELVLDEFELPHPAATPATTTTNVHTFNRLKPITARSSQMRAT